MRLEGSGTRETRGNARETGRLIPSDGFGNRLVLFWMAQRFPGILEPPEALPAAPPVCLRASSSSPAQLSLLRSQYSVLPNVFHDALKAAGSPQDQPLYVPGM